LTLGTFSRGRVRREIYGAVLSGSAGSTTAYGGGVFADAPYNTAFDFFTIAFSVIDPKFYRSKLLANEG